jgi:hypothetical protein
MRYSAVIALCALAIAGCGEDEPESAGAPSKRALAGAPAPLAKLHRQANELLPGGAAGFKRRLRELKG